MQWLGLYTTYYSLEFSDDKYRCGAGDLRCSRFKGLTGTTVAHANENRAGVTKIKEHLLIYLLIDVFLNNKTSHLYHNYQLSKIKPYNSTVTLRCTLYNLKIKIFPSILNRRGIFFNFNF
jgi:hypothetical protein